jgi:hypothetical protein
MCGVYRRMGNSIGLSMRSVTREVGYVDVASASSHFAMLAAASP